jgi:hypothetical protein
MRTEYYDYDFDFDRNVLTDDFDFDRNVLTDDFDRNALIDHVD